MESLCSSLPVSCSTSSTTSSVSASASSSYNVYMYINNLYNYNVMLWIEEQLHTFTSALTSSTSSISSSG